MRKSLLLTGAVLLLAGCGTGGKASSHADQSNGQKVFQAKCAGCHTLAAAGSTGTVGPNLDQLGSTLTVAVVTHQVEVGGGPMPAFQGKLSAAQIQAVAQYVSSSVGKK